ncbi:hypothetical protein COCON_G00180870 [Conger conger]|uniref:Uncharacterized protein n=1 Tax=Conger conger TaxID=82655 RepID=A0A9Q1HRD9_CONCO|nr:hypothetical protein COCON_G00180870 [Conger conger]
MESEDELPGTALWPRVCLPREMPGQAEHERLSETALTRHQLMWITGSWAHPYPVWLTRTQAPAAARPLESSSSSLIKPVVEVDLWAPFHHVEKLTKSKTCSAGKKDTAVMRKAVM